MCGTARSLSGSERRLRRWPSATLVIAVVALLSALRPASAFAGYQRWTAQGPGGCIVLSLAIGPSVPSTLYAGTSGGGVFKSLNGGQSWTAINNGIYSAYAGLPGPPEVLSLAIDPLPPTTLYAGTGRG